MFYAPCTFSLPLELSLKNDLKYVQDAGVFFLWGKIAEKERYRGSGIRFDRKTARFGILIFCSSHFLHNKSKFRGGDSYYTWPTYAIFSKCSIQIATGIPKISTSGCMDTSGVRIVLAETM
jgi:hypothetical protein